jgi:hypothetical protein
MRLVNLTPHPITFHVGGHDVLTLPPSGCIARCEVRTETMPALALDASGLTLPVVRVTVGALENLPPPLPDTIHVVSRLAAEAAKQQFGRTEDILYPEAPVRDAAGNIIGCSALGRV